MRDIAEDSKQRSSSEEKKDGNKKLIIIIIAVAVVIIAGLATTVIILLNKKEAPGGSDPVVATTTQEPEKRDVLVTEDNIEEFAEQITEREYVQPGYYTVVQNFEWHFPHGNEESTDAHVENTIENTNDVYFDVFLYEDDQNPIYQSPIIPLGATLEHFKLDQELDAGTYDCVMVYHLVDSDQKSLSTLSISVKVIVEQ